MCDGSVRGKSGVYNCVRHLHVRDSSPTTLSFPRPAGWITGYQLLIILLVPVLLAAGVVHTWRYGIIGLLIPITYLLTITA